jgi:lipopolysaccharide assembly outer membrane protein LptD (OstA)
MEDVGIIHRKDGDVKWTLKAKEAVFVNKTEVNLSDLSIRFPEKELILTARNGTYGLENQNLTISGDLKAVTKDYDIVATSVFWDASKNQLFSDKKVSLVGSTFFVEGDSLIATSDKATLTKNVKAVFYDK